MHTITLTKGKKAIINKADDTGMKWYYGGNGYAMRRTPERCEYLHRHVMERDIGRKLSSTEHVDHINGNKLDCRRRNLRLCTISQNLANARIRTDNTSGVRGVSLDKRNGNYTAQVYVKGKKTHIGSYKTFKEAVKARRDKELELYGDFVVRGQGR